MRIAIDARMMGAETTRGIGRYIQELIHALLELAEQASEQHTFILITRQREHPFAQHRRVETIVADIPWYSVAEQLFMPAVFRRANADIVHVPHWNVPLAFFGPCVVTVHDLLLRHFPHSAKSSTRNGFFRAIKTIGFRIVLDAALRKARRILVPTHFVAQDVSTLYPTEKSKVMVTGEGMPSVQAYAQVQEQSTPYILYVGSAYPHKGLHSLLMAWKQISQSHPDIRLKLVGEKDVFMKGIEQEVRELDISHVEFLGRVGDQALQHLYAGAIAFVFPSLFEGFGLPPLEALAQGCPVIASDAGSLPEVIGPDNAFFFRAGDSDAIISAVERVLADPAQAHIQALAAAHDCARRHAWSKTARVTLDAYHTALQNVHVA